MLLCNTMVLAVKWRMRCIPMMNVRRWYLIYRRIQWCIHHHSNYVKVNSHHSHERYTKQFLRMIALNPLWYLRVWVLLPRANGVSIAQPYAQVMLSIPYATLYILYTTWSILRDYQHKSKRWAKDIFTCLMLSASTLSHIHTHHLWVSLSDGEVSVSGAVVNSHT